jgi:transcriptional regulator with PAS, ATPase and Fis domain
LPRELIASELFGYEEGAFTGARRGGNLGKFELAHQGTIFLDEIGDMPLDSQAMLLRVIEEKTIVRLGGSKSIPVNVRIIAATNKDLQAEVENNTFRRDLFYRLGVIKIIIPPLRERTEDIAILSQHFLSVLCRRFNLPKKTLSPEVLYAFQNYSWPGNIRELQNILESAVQWSVSPIISKNQIEQLLPAIKPSQQVSIEKIVDPEEPLELKQIKACLAKYDNNKSKTAKALGISRKTLYKRLDKYGLSSS